MEELNRAPLLQVFYIIHYTQLLATQHHIPEQTWNYGGKLAHM